MSRGVLKEEATVERRFASNAVLFACLGGISLDSCSGLNETKTLCVGQGRYA